jgi:excisionase family DNA binding protein
MLLISNRQYQTDQGGMSMLAVDDKRLVLTVSEAAELLKIGRSCAYEAIRNGQLPVIRMGRRILVPRAALERLLESGS